jgi:hypothetical protein
LLIQAILKLFVAGIPCPLSDQLQPQLAAPAAWVGAAAPAGAALVGFSAVSSVTGAPLPPPLPARAARPRMRRRVDAVPV